MRRASTCIHTLSAWPDPEIVGQTTTDQNIIARTTVHLVSPRSRSTSKDVVAVHTKQTIRACAANDGVIATTPVRRQPFARMFQQNASLRAQVRYLAGMTLLTDLADCRQCANRFAATPTRHAPRPLVWFRPGAPILIASQAPGMRAYKSGIPFDDPSGERLRDWMGLDRDRFLDRRNVAIAPMGFCFPGYDAQGGDIPPPRDCSRLWRERVLAHIGPPRVTLLIGARAQEWHLGRGRVTDRVRQWADLAPAVFPLPHPS